MVNVDLQAGWLTLIFAYPTAPDSPDAVEGSLLNKSKNKSPLEKGAGGLTIGA